ncbi:MAG: T9SS type A sorting domain-containing protein [Bacteroidota bacterium]
MKKILLLILLVCPFAAFTQPANINISNTNAFEGEPYISVNPNDPRKMVIAWIASDLSTGFKSAIKTKTSINGGATWGNQYIHPHFSTTWHSADPSMQYRTNGTLYLSYIDYHETPDSGGVYITHSTDNGISWSAPTRIYNIFTDDPSKKPLDRPWLAVDNSGTANDGNFYITTKPAPWISPPNRPYLKTSADSGQTWSAYRYIDTTNYLVGNVIAAPMAAPTVSADGALCVAYPSYLPSQSVFPKIFFAKSYNNGTSFQYYDLLINPNGPSDPNYEKGYCLAANPANANQLAFAYVDSINGDPDTYITTTNNGGISWNNPTRVNDDPPGNGKAQDMVWASYSNTGNLLVSWRDRRNGAGSSFYQASDIYCAVSINNGLSFQSNIRLSSMTAPYHSILTSDGNDFMCSKFVNDTIYATWGDVRTNNLNIFFARISAGVFTDIKIINSENEEPLVIFPNPANNELYITVKNKELKQLEVQVFNQLGQEVMNKSLGNGIERSVLNISQLTKGVYFIRVTSEKRIISYQKIVLRR